MVWGGMGQNQVAKYPLDCIVKTENDRLVQIHWVNSNHFNLRIAIVQVSW